MSRTVALDLHREPDGAGSTESAGAIEASDRTRVTTAPSTTPAAGVAHPGVAAVVVVIGCVLLEARGLLVAVLPDPAVTLVVLFVVVGAVGLAWPIGPSGSAEPNPHPWTRSAAVFGVGVVAFGLGRWVGAGQAPGLDTWPLVAASALAAVAEEAFFRRLCFALLLPAGTTWAVVGSAVLFAAVHLTTYGAWVLPLDLAAGLVLGWQRLASGSWRVPALTHVIVNLLVVI